jgi:hypothetical protein
VNCPSTLDRQPGAGSAALADVLPFSKRPRADQEYFLRSGDYEAVHPETRSEGRGDIPAAPRVPVFARQAASTSTPYGFAQPRPHYGHADLAAPPPPNSLAPVAMGAAAGATGPQRAQPTLFIRQKPSLKWGVMIAIGGALLGGLLGLGMDAKRQQARAAAAAEAHASAPAPAVVATVLPGQAPPTSGLNPVPVVPAVATVGAVPAVLPPPQPIAAALPKTEAPAKADKPEKHASKPAAVKHQTFVAAKVPAPKPPVEKAEAPAKVDPPPKAEKAEKADKADKTGKAAAAPSDARKVLEDAIKDTTNTL